jgi:hypothetical protein
MFLSTIRDLRIIGTPEIPDEIDLIQMAGWHAWRSDIYGDWSSQDANSGAPYVRQNDEIFGNLREIGDSKNLEFVPLHQGIQSCHWRRVGFYRQAQGLR